MSARRAAPIEIPLCFMIRSEVFIEEQGVPAQIVMDGLDADCAQFIAIVNDEPAGSARLRFISQSEAKAERVAVLQASRGRGLGIGLMRAMEREARVMGIGSVVLHSQASAVGFYEGIGYVRDGDSFVEADIVHYKMRKAV